MNGRDFCHIPQLIVTMIIINQIYIALFIVHKDDLYRDTKEKSIYITRSIDIRIWGRGVAIS